MIICNFFGSGYAGLGYLSMDIVRRNTDYALRAIVSFARHYNDGLQSTRKVACQQHIPYSLACKLMQKLHAAKLVESTMGPEGGFRLSKDPAKITLLEIIETIQGPINVSRCLLGQFKCPLKTKCPLRAKFYQLQEQMVDYLNGVTLADLLKKQSMR